jgi:hypothetical protein
MAKFVATDHKITINATNFSDSLQSVDLTIQADEVDTTTFGGAWKTVTGGLRSGSLTLNFYQDFAAGSVDAVLWPLAEHCCNCYHYTNKHSRFSN